MAKTRRRRRRKGELAEKIFFVEQIAVEIIAQRAAEKIEPGEEGGRHRGAASAVSFTVKKNCRWARDRSKATTKEERAAQRNKLVPTEIVERWRPRLEETSWAEAHWMHKAGYFRQPWEHRPRCVCDKLFGRGLQFCNTGMLDVARKGAVSSLAELCNASAACSVVFGLS